jgi:hypothetical protein
MSAARTFYEGYKKNRNLFIFVLMTPVIGMAVAIPIIIWQAPKNMPIVIAVIFFLIVQYTVTIFFMIKRIERLDNSKEEPVLTEK